MRTFLLFLFLSIVFVAVSQDLNHQEQIMKAQNSAVIFSASWSTAIPMGELTSYSRMSSGRGFQFELNQVVNEKWTYGGTIGWQAFFDINEVWYISENSVISGIRRNYINSLAFLGNTKYYFSTSVNGIKAYLSLDIGATVIENYEIFGLYKYRELEWHYTMVPGLGIDIPATEKLGFQIYFKYPNSFKNNSSIHYSWLNTGAGIYLKILD